MRLGRWCGQNSARVQQIILLDGQAVAAAAGETPALRLDVVHQVAQAHAHVVQNVIGKAGGNGQSQRCVNQA